MRRVAVGLAVTLVAGAATGAPAPYEAPPETATLAPGKDVEIAEAICSSCHSLDYITTQPPMGETAKAFWTASVRKMQTAYGSDMSAEDAAKIVAYLAETYR